MYRPQRELTMLNNKIKFYPKNFFFNASLRTFQPTCIYNLREMPKTELLNHCKDLENILTDGESSDISAIDLADELSDLCTLLEKQMSPREVLKLIISLFYFMPNVIIALRIILTLPLSVPSCEINFSKIKIIKNYLRTMTQDRLSGLALIAIEHESCDKL